jgi:polyhydroxybutyrate depolymerase
MSGSSSWFGPHQTKEVLRASSRNLVVDGRDRRYELFVYPGTDSTKEAPLIMGFHGAGSIPAHFAYISQLNRRAGSLGYVVAYPAAGGFWLRDSAQENNDLAFVESMLRDISTQVRIDSQRIYATGMSNGGQMVYKIACEMADVITAISVCACGMRRGVCHLKRAVPVLHFHGTEDPLVPYAWGSDAVRQWIELDACESVPTETFKNGAASCLSYSNPSTGARVTFCTIQGMGHQYPGVAIRLTESETKLLGLPPILSRLGPGTDDLDATAMSLSFFANFPRQTIVKEDEEEA